MNYNKEELQAWFDTINDEICTLENNIDNLPCRDCSEYWRYTEEIERLCDEKKDVEECLQKLSVLSVSL